MLAKLKDIFPKSHIQEKLKYLEIDINKNVKDLTVLDLKKIKMIVQETLESQNGIFQAVKVDEAICLGYILQMANGLRLNVYVDKIVN